WTKIAAKTRSSKTVLKTSLDSFIAMRNACAHSGVPSSIPSPREIRGYCVLLNAIARSIVLVLDDCLAGMGPAVPIAAPAAGIAAPTAAAAAIAAPAITTARPVASTKTWYVRFLQALIERLDK